MREAQGLVGGQYHQSTLIDMPLQDSLHLSDRNRIKGGKGFIENPELCIHQCHSSQGRSLALALREKSHPSIPKPQESEGLQDGINADGIQSLTTNAK